MSQANTNNEIAQVKRDLDFARYQLKEIEDDLRQLEKSREAPPTYLKRKELALKREVAALEEALGGKA